MNLRVALFLPVAILCGLSNAAFAGPPWTSFLPFRRVAADKQQVYELREKDGPWLILAASFSGEGAEVQARELIYELRKRLQIPAYLHRKKFDFTEGIDGVSHTGRPKRMRYDKAVRYDEIAVLVGDFPSIDDTDLSKTLEKIKFARPECLDLEKRDSSTQRFAGLRQLYRKMNGDELKRNKGPMGSAFATRNPLLPKEYFSQGGPDEFVVNLNRRVKFSLLQNPGKFTVRVATFRGEYTINMSKIADLEMSGEVSDKLEVAAQESHRLTMALRKQDIEAYEYHDRHESIVTIGSFDTEGVPLPNGTVDINPEILDIMKKFGGVRQSIPGRPEVGLQPQTLDGVVFDIQPYPIPVPRRSIGTAYSRRSFLR